MRFYTSLIVLNRHFDHHPQLFCALSLSLPPALVKSLLHIKKSFQTRLNFARIVRKKPLAFLNHRHKAAKWTARLNPILSPWRTVAWHKFSIMYNWLRWMKAPGLVEWVRGVKLRAVFPSCFPRPPFSKVYEAFMELPFGLNSSLLHQWLTANLL